MNKIKNFLTQFVDRIAPRRNRESRAPRELVSLARVAGALERPNSTVMGGRGFETDSNGIRWHPLSRN